MHLLFIPYGTRPNVEYLLREMESQAFEMPVWKGEEKSKMWIKGAIRMIGGVYEYIFPREALHLVLATLIRREENMDRYHLGWIRTKMLEKIFRVEKLPEHIDFTSRYIWIKDHVNIIPIGIRHDKDTTERQGPHIGWMHEAI